MSCFTAKYCGQILIFVSGASFGGVIDTTSFTDILETMFVKIRTALAG